jgi:hypothetical protein
VISPGFGQRYEPVINLLAQTQVPPESKKKALIMSRRRLAKR